MSSNVTVKHILKLLRFKDFTIVIAELYILLLKTLMHMSSSVDFSINSFQKMVFLMHFMSIVFYFFSRVFRKRICWNFFLLRVKHTFSDTYMWNHFRTFYFLITTHILIYALDIWMKFEILWNFYALLYHALFEE